MKILYCIFLVVILNSVWPASLFAQSFVCDGRFLISSYMDEIEGSEESSLFKVDFEEGQVTFIDPVAFPGVKINGVGYNRQDHFVYAINQTSVILEDGRKVYNILRLSADGTYQELPLGEGAINTIRWDYSAADCSPEGYFVVHDQKNQHLHYLDVSGNEVTLQQSIPLRWTPAVGIADFYVEMNDFAFDVDNSGTIYSHQRSYDKVEEESEETRGTLLKIDGNLGSPNAGTVSVVGRTDPGVVVHVGAMFFSATGKLYGYGLKSWPQPEPAEPRRLLAIDKASGEATFVGDAPDIRTTDGCSCPFTVGLMMQTSSSADPCQTTLRYDVVIQNNASVSVSGIVFTDTLPEGVVIADIAFPEEFSYELEEDTGVGFGVLTLKNLSLPPATEITFTIEGTVRGLSGTIEHQAYLTNLPPSLGSVLASDDNTTAQPYDPSVVTIAEEIPLLKLTEDTVLCQGETLTLSAQVDPAWSFYWTDAYGFYSQEADPTIALPEGEDSVYYYLHQQRGNCTLVDSVLITTLPTPNLVIANDTTIVVGTTIALAPTLTEEPDAIYQWTPAEGLSCTDCANPQATPAETTNYELQRSSPLGCVQRQEVTIEVTEPEPMPEPEPKPVKDVLIPNAFTPNNDGMNDVFFPIANDRVTFQVLEIYNRWGEMIFTVSDFSPDDTTHGWDGTYQGRQGAAGTYTYRLVALIEEKGRQEYRGKVHLLY